MSGPEDSTASRVSRYARQIILPGVGEAGQERLRASRVAIVGVGALGCVSADLLVRAGVGRVMLIDRDVIEWSNLQRQTLYDEDDARRGVPKADAAAARLARVNHEVVIDARVADLHPGNIERVLAMHSPSDRPQVILDGTDNFETRYLLNDACVKHAVAFAYAGALGTHGMQATFMPGGACLRCVFESPPAPGCVQTCESAGVFAPAVSIAASAQAADAIKILLGRADLLTDSLLEFDLWHNTRRRVDLRAARREDCPACALRRFEFLDHPRRDGGVTLCGQQSVQISTMADSTLDLLALAKRLEPLGTVERTRFMLRFTPSEHRSMSLSVFGDARVIVRGTNDIAKARALCARYIGS